MTKVKISITLSEDLVARIDEAARAGPGTSRSAIIERWIRRVARSRAAEALGEATIAYYESLADEDRAEDAAISRAFAKRARGLQIDD